MALSGVLNAGAVSAVSTVSSVSPNSSVSQVSQESVSQVCESPLPYIAAWLQAGMPVDSVGRVLAAYYAAVARVVTPPRRSRRRRRSCRGSRSNSRSSTSSLGVVTITLERACQLIAENESYAYGVLLSDPRHITKFGQYPMFGRLLSSPAVLWSDTTMDGAFIRRRVQGDMGCYHVARSGVPAVQALSELAGNAVWTSDSLGAKLAAGGLAVDQPVLKLNCELGGDLGRKVGIDSVSGDYPDGYCYLSLVSKAVAAYAAVRLGPYPTVLAVASLPVPAIAKGKCMDQSADNVLHVSDKGFPAELVLGSVARQARLGGIALGGTYSHLYGSSGPSDWAYFKVGGERGTPYVRTIASAYAAAEDSDYEPRAVRHHFRGLICHWFTCDQPYGKFPDLIYLPDGIDGIEAGTLRLGRSALCQLADRGEAGAELVVTSVGARMLVFIRPDTWFSFGSVSARSGRNGMLVVAKHAVALGFRPSDSDLQVFVSVLGVQQWRVWCSHSLVLDAIHSAFRMTYVDGALATCVLSTASGTFQAAKDLTADDEWEARTLGECYVDSDSKMLWSFGRGGPVSVEVNFGSIALPLSPYGSILSLSRGQRVTLTGVDFGVGAVPMSGRGVVRLSGILDTYAFDGGGVSCGDECVSGEDY